MTEYSMFSTQDLIEFAARRDNRTPLEQELAERLYHAHDALRADTEANNQEASQWMQMM
jgi:hypothetical protein